MSTVKSFIFLPKILVNILPNHRPLFLPVGGSSDFPESAINLLQLSSSTIKENVRIERGHQRSLIIQVDGALIIVKRTNIAPVRRESIAQQPMAGVKPGSEQISQRAIKAIYNCVSFDGLT